MGSTEKSREAVRHAGLPSPSPSDLEKTQHESGESEAPGHRVVVADKLARKLSARQVSMIAIGGTIGEKYFSRANTGADNKSQALDFFSGQASHWRLGVRLRCS